MTTVFATLTAAAPWIGIPVLAAIAWAAGARRFADASRAAVLTWCREIAREDSPTLPLPSQPKRRTR